jgi:hypothetical protein
MGFIRYVDKKGDYIKNIIIKIVLLLMLSYNQFVFASVLTTVDIYKSNQVTSYDIYKRFNKELNSIAMSLLDVGSSNDKNRFEDIANKIKYITANIYNMGEFSYVHISPVIYPGDNKVYFSLDLVDKKDKRRLDVFLNQPKESIPDPDRLLSLWFSYERKGMDLLFKHSDLKEINSCSAYHCLFGFSHPALLRYKNLFDLMVEKNKQQLVTILRRDRDENKRYAAAYLLAHIKNGRELIQILIPSIKDCNAKVRNSVMRVLGSTLTKVKTANFPIEKIIKALDYPAETDRNKALYILQSLSVQPIYAEYIRNHASNEIIAQLKMQQPNLHNTAYQILKKISGKNFDEMNYIAWNKWLNNNLAS